MAKQKEAKPEKVADQEQANRPVPGSEVSNIHHPANVLHHLRHVGGSQQDQPEPQKNE